MNAKVLVVALCAFQLAAGGPLDTIIEGVQNVISSVVEQAQANATAIQQNIQSSGQNASSNAESQAQDWLSGFLKNVSDAISDAKEAEPKIQACLKNQSAEYKQVLESTKDKIQADVQSKLAATASAVTNISAAVIKAKLSLAQIPASYLKCSAKSVLSFLPIIGSSSSSSSASCLTQATNQLKNLTNDVTAAVQSSLQQAQAQPKDTKSDDKPLQTAAAEYQKINEETSACVQDAVASSNAASDPSSTASDPSDSADSSSDAAESA